MIIMEPIQNLTHSVLWAAAISLVLFIAGSIAIGFLSKKSEQLKPVGSGLKLILLFLALQVFLHLGAAERYPRVALPLNFVSWIVFTFAALRQEHHHGHRDRCGDTRFAEGDP
jgi:uncharacterized membrane protein YoaK (UPF0700 family)